MATRNAHTIYIDGQAVTYPERRISGDALKALVEPRPNGIWLDVPDAQDRLISDDAVIAVEDGMRFFTDRLYTVYLDKVAYEVPGATISEQDLRALPTPPVAGTHVIWKDLIDDVDRALRPGEITSIANGDRFFTKPRRQDGIAIIVNARRHTVADEIVTFEQVASLAFPDGPSGENITYTVAYAKARAPKPQGSLTPGASVTVKEGTTFNVTLTDKS